jgi:hypothetical protein
MEQLHEHYDICITHTLVDVPDVCLKEEEVVLGYNSCELRPVTVALTEHTG